MPHQPIPGEQPPGKHAEELLAMVAHELRQPLTALRGALLTLQHRTQALSGPQQQELLGMARRQGEQLQRLLDQLLAAASVDHLHAPSARRSLVDAAALVEEAGQAARLAHPNHRITIEAAGPLPVRVDPLAISRILGNLLDNAAAHCPPGSLIRLIGSRDGTQAVLAVQDQGRASQPMHASASSIGTRAVPGTPDPLPVGWASGCTSPGAWPTPTTASCTSPTTRPATGPAWSCACRWPHPSTVPPRRQSATATRRHSRTVSPPPTPSYIASTGGSHRLALLSKDSTAPQESWCGIRQIRQLKRSRAGAGQAGGPRRRQRGGAARRRL